MTLPTPLQLDLSRSAGLKVEWSDGLRSAISLMTLRESCPCATCRDRREQQAKNANPLRVIPAAPELSLQITPEAIDSVGNYAIRIRWKDGHDTGIYSYQLLRQLSESKPM